MRPGTRCNKTAIDLNRRTYLRRGPSVQHDEPTSERHVLELILRDIDYGRAEIPTGSCDIDPRVDVSTASSVVGWIAKKQVCLSR